MALSFTAISADGRHSLAGTTSGFNSEIDDEEVDQLDSGLDDDGDEMEPEVEEDEASSSASGKGRRKLGVRLPGHTLVPQDRLDNILQAEGAGPHMSKEAVYMLSIATEEFVKRLAEAGYQQTVAENRQHVQYRDMANVAHRRSAYKFLEDTIPRPLSIAEAMQLRAMKERELLDDDPAISTAIPPSPSPLPTQISSTAASVSARAKPAVRQSLPAQPNGQTQKTNGSASAPGAPADGAETIASASASRSSRHRDRRGRWSNAPSANGSHEGTPSSTAGTEARAGSARIRNRSARAREAAEAAHPPRGRGSQANGSSSSAQRGRTTSNASANHVSEPAAAPGQGQIIGPASAYLENGSPLLANGRSFMTDNPGRTIYSQQRSSPQQPR